MPERVTIPSVIDKDKRPKGHIMLWSHDLQTFILKSRDGKILGRFSRSELTKEMRNTIKLGLKIPKRY